MVCKTRIKLKSIKMKEFLFSIPGIICVLGFICLIFLSGISPKKKMITDVSLRSVMQIIISVVIVAAGLYVILTDKYPADTAKWAYSIIGVIVGFWLQNTAVRLNPKS